MNRRTFLTRMGAAGLAIVTAPLFVPSERLAFGVPKVMASASPPLLSTEGVLSVVSITPWGIGTMRPVLLEGYAGASALAVQLGGQDAQRWLDDLALEWVDTSDPKRPRIIGYGDNIVVNESQRFAVRCAPVGTGHPELLAREIPFVAYPQDVSG